MKRPVTDTPGAWLNATTPNLCDLLRGLDLDHQAFDAWLGNQLEELRLAGDLKSGPWPMPTAAEEETALRMYLDALETIARFQPGNLPPLAKAHLTAEGFKDGVNSLQMARQFQLGAVTLRAYATRALAKIEKTPGPGRGRPSVRGRDQFLADVIERLSDAVPTSAKARELAEVILIRCGVKVPAGERSIRRATGRAGGNK